MLLYEDALKTRHADWILDQYRASAEHDLRPTSDRTTYRCVVDLMKRMQRLPGGRLVVREMMEDFKNATRAGARSWRSSQSLLKTAR